MLSQVPFWDSIADSKTFSHPLDLNRFAALVDRDARILDYGCGYGRLTGELYAAGYHDVTGVDPAPRMIERARSAYPQIAFATLDSAEPPFADASFDAVLLFSVLTCIIDDGEQRAVVADIARVLRPGGIVYVSDIQIQDDERNRARYDAFVDAHRSYGVFELEPGIVFRHLSLAWVTELFSRFEQLDRRDVPIVTMNGNPAKGFQFIGRIAANETADKRFKKYAIDTPSDRSELR